MAVIGETFSVLQARLLGATPKEVQRKVYEGGADGIWHKPVKNTVISYDIDNDGSPDVRLTTRVQDLGAWSYDGMVGRTGVTQDVISVLDGEGRVTDVFVALTAHRQGLRVVNALRGESTITDIVGSVTHIDYLGDARRVTSTRGHATDDGQGNPVIDWNAVETESAVYRDRK